jgi:hypothetical protein
MSLADVLSQVSRVLQCEICAAAFQCAMMLPCGHVFCSACIRRALTYQELCPVCKQPHIASQLTPVRRLDAVRDLLHNLGALVSSALATASATATATATASSKPKKTRSRQLKRADDDDEAYNDDEDDNDDDAEQHSSRRSSRQAASIDVDVASDDDFRQLPKSGKSVSASKKRRVAAVPSRKVPELRTVVDWMAPVEQRANVPRNPHFKSLSLPSLKTRMQQFNLSTAGKRETLEARLREFVLRCQINADSIEPLSMAQIAREVSAIDFTSASSAALSRSSSALAANNDDDLEEAIVVSMLQQQEEQQRQQQLEQTADAAPTRQRAATQSQASMQSQAAAEPQVQAVPQPEPAPPTLLQRVSQIARSVDFGEWRVVWSNKYQCPFYFCPRTGAGTFEKPAAIAVDIYEQAQQAQRAREHAT